MSTEVVQERESRPATDPLWGIETNGINPIPESERHGKPFELFWIWFASNVSVLAIIYGAMVVTYGVNLWQAVLAAAIGTWLSFLLVGFVSLAGKRGNAPTLVLSRAPFGALGNAFPTLVSYLSLVGWETVLVILSTLATETILDRLGVHITTPITAITFVIVAAMVILIGLLGHSTIVRIQTWFTWAFGALTIVFIALEIPQVHFHQLATAPAGPWLNGVVPAASIMMAALGLGWVNAAADYSRYLPRDARSGGVVGWTTFGGSIAPFVLIVFGALISVGDKGALWSSANPIGDLSKHLPTWFLVPYLLVAVGSLVAGALLDIYSSGLNLLTLGVRLPRYITVVFDGAIMIAGNIYILFYAKSFLGPFQGFLITLGVPLTAWVAVFLVDMAMFRRRGYSEPDLYRLQGRYRYVAGFNPSAVVAWVAGVVVGWGLVTSTAKVFSWVGWWAKGHPLLENSSLGIVASFAVAALLYLVLSLVWRPAPSEAAAAESVQAA